MPLPFQLNPVETRILGCLVEKQLTTPEVYPLSLNALTLACNQKSNRDPLLDLSEADVIRGVDALREKHLAMMLLQAGSRVPKYSQELGKMFGLEPPALALLCELLVRGPQTSGELRGRASRMVPFACIEAVEEVLASLVNRSEPLVVLLPRQPGRKESRYAHLLSGEIKVEELAAVSVAPAEKARLVVQAEQERVEKLETEVAALRQELSALQSQFAEFRRQFE